MILQKIKNIFDSCIKAINSTKQMANDINDLYLKDFSLCHGISGIGDILLFAYDVLKDGDYKKKASELGSYGIDRYIEEGLPFPLNVKGMNPNLMIGIAGIGNFYLRLFDSKKFDSSLFL